MVEASESAKPTTTTKPADAAATKPAAPEESKIVIPDFSKLKPRQV